MDRDGHSRIMPLKVCQGTPREATMGRPWNPLKDKAKEICLGSLGGVASLAGKRM